MRPWVGPGRARDKEELQASPSRCPEVRPARILAAALPRVKAISTRSRAPADQIGWRMCRRTVAWPFRFGRPLEFARIGENGGPGGEGPMSPGNLKRDWPFFGHKPASTPAPTLGSFLLLPERRGRSSSAGVRTAPAGRGDDQLTDRRDRGREPLSCRAGGAGRGCAASTSGRRRRQRRCHRRRCCPRPPASGFDPRPPRWRGLSRGGS